MNCLYYQRSNQIKVLHRPGVAIERGSAAAVLATALDFTATKVHKLSSLISILNIRLI